MPCPQSLRQLCSCSGETAGGGVSSAGASPTEDFRGRRTLGGGSTDVAAGGADSEDVVGGGADSADVVGEEGGSAAAAASAEGAGLPNAFSTTAVSEGTAVSRTRGAGGSSTAWTRMSP